MWMLRIGLVGALDAAADAADALGGLVEFLGERQRFFLLELGQTLAIDGSAPAVERRRRREEAVGAERYRGRGIMAGLCHVHGLLKLGKKASRRGRDERQARGWRTAAGDSPCTGDKCQS